MRAVGFRIGLELELELGFGGGLTCMAAGPAD
jgi:hypothetical protein